MTTSLHNGFTTVYSTPGLQPGMAAIDHTATGSAAGNLVGTFGTNWIFYVPVRGRAAGVVHPFGYGPPRCEMTGPPPTREGADPGARIQGRCSRVPGRQPHPGRPAT